MLSYLLIRSTKQNIFDLPMASGAVTHIYKDFKLVMEVPLSNYAHRRTCYVDRYEGRAYYEYVRLFDVNTS